MSTAPTPSPSPSPSSDEANLSPTAPAPRESFAAFLQRGLEAGGFGTDDVLAAILPLLDQVARVHERGLVAPLDGVAALHVEHTHLWFEEAHAQPPRKNTARIEALQRLTHGRGIEVVGEFRRAVETGTGALDERSLLIGEPGAEIERPIYLPGYVAWEHRCGHHDQLTDIFSLGLLLASLACALDLADPDDLRTFVEHRDNLFALNARLHPVIAAAITQMTELNRHRRAQTIDALAHRLRHYRDQEVDSGVDFHQLAGFRDGTPTERGKIILAHLRNRLFEISRRNRLIHFKPTLQTLNLTLASVPLLLDHRNIRPEQLFLWHDAIAKPLVAGETIVLGNFLRFEEAPYAPGVLDQIIATERRDRAEFGFAQLRLVLCFLRWHNLKEFPEERIHSPLLLLPIELTKKKGVRDAYVLRALSSVAEVNPALRHHLHQLYGLDLPAAVDLAETTVEAFHELLAAQIRASEPGVTLNRLDRPQIQLIHERARLRLDQFRRRQRQLARGGARPFESFDYSYERERLRPLGLQLFNARVRPARSPFAAVTGAAPQPRRPHLIEPADQNAGSGATPSGAAQREQQTYAVREPGGGGNPYSWDFDLCSLTLGNFNYRKMSLVQDYAAMLEQPGQDASFESIFALHPRPREEDTPPAEPLAQQFPVVDCDPTQTRAVLRARTGASYIIQGPPGTGKSQTITNLIADHVARGQRVLFVCEKRAAIDVVFHRLARRGLDELCCLIHDSQTDKREFIRNLKQTYEAFLNDPLDETLEARRTELIRQLEREHAALQRWTEAMQARLDGASITVRALLARLIELRPHRVDLDALTLEQVPAYAQWEPAAAVVKALADGLRRLGGARTLARHSFRHLPAAALTSTHPLATITTAVDESAALLRQIGEALAPLEESVSAVQTPADVQAVVDFATRLAPLAAADALELVNPRSAMAKDAARAVREWRAAEKHLEKCRAATVNWRDKLPLQDTLAAHALALKVEDSLVRWFQPAFWRLRGVMRTRYDFAKHAVPPKWSNLLDALHAEHLAAAKVDESRQHVASALGDLEPDTGVTMVETLPATLDTLPPPARALHAYLVENSEATFVVEQLAALGSTMARLRERLGLVMEEFADLSLAGLDTELKQLRADLTWLPDLLPLLADTLQLPADVRAALRKLPLTDTQLEAAMAHKSLVGVYQRDRTLEATEGPHLARRIARLQAAHREWLELNARWIRQKVRREFLRKVKLCGVSATQLSPEEREFKKLYSTGRRELEHEFSKTMRHRSIRDLADDETGVVLRDLKPVWLMSPLSVSDTLPLAAGAFDVVIFDEASQIPVEEALPAVFRAPQVIVVGDEMQLPPTNFFSASQHADELIVEDDDAESIAGDLDADSFLTQSARHLPSTLLGWHYRSRSEALISYSNNAFYEGRLLTIPDLQLQRGDAGEIVVQSPEEGRANLDALLARSVSFHHLPGAIYERRCNTSEADYIAHLVREILARDLKRSLGIVAFSEAQQGEIEAALTRLAADDAEFRNRLENEYEREEDGQFCGLFVKNLENVQGDERDIVLLSICYGYDRGRRMLMNFGPINQRGGEKRLNVIFSRARLHMAVVSSIRHHDITNDYNDGAACLRHFLEYAAACSRGDAATARRVLGLANPLGEAPAARREPDAVTLRLAEALRARGLVAETHVGQSTFRVPLAVRRPDDAAYRLAILVDDADHYAQDDLLERYLLRPGVLQAFGWTTLTVFTKDWHHAPDEVLRRIERALEGEPEADFDGDLDEELEEADESSVAMEPSPVTVVEEPAVYGAAEMTTPAAAPTPPAAPGAKRHFELIEGPSKKFWAVTTTGNEVAVHFGRIGTKGQTQTKTFSTPAAALREQEKLIRSKVAKGYTEKPAP
ncbi:MAG: WGR domain-containing protein [Opitutaceae bacterium]|nr:WGR domain-containing protein [Opitutaceae bacterium]